ncbi:MAG: ATP-binding cassette domain-containing protein [Bdellovibrionota bacterium]
MSTNEQHLLEVKNLKTHFPIKKGSFFSKTIANVKAVDGVSLNLTQGEVLGLVGESGCGKSTLGRSILRLIDPTDGVVSFEGKVISEYSKEELRKVRPQFQMIFQDPYASLDPRMTVYDALSEPILAHKIVPKSEIEKEVQRLMNLVGLASRFIHKYPHEFSGGQRQRIAIARALALRPKLIIADEPVSALDVSIQSQILNLLNDLRKELNLTMIFISHDLGVIKYLCDRVAVMYLGKIVELTTTDELFKNSVHPYTQALLSAIPLPDPELEKKRERVILQGDPPSPLNPPPGCAFAPRCPKKKSALCETKVPTLIEMKAGHWVTDCPCNVGHSA